VRPDDARCRSETWLAERNDFWRFAPAWRRHAGARLLDVSGRSRSVADEQGDRQPGEQDVGSDAGNVGDDPRAGGSFRRAPVTAADPKNPGPLGRAAGSRVTV
jgi:hypothetical protein